MRSALALRTSLVTAVIAGTLLAPAASSAFAASTADARTVATAIETGAQIGRYEGKPVYIGEGLVAVLRNEAEGPEAWIRYVGPDWKPGDTYIVRVMGLLNRTETTATLSGLQLKLTKAETASPVLTVTKDGATKSYPLPKGKAVPAASCVSKVKKVAVGMYMTADLTMSPQGPKAFVHATDPKDTSGMVTLTRTSPKGPDDYYLRIANPSGAAPVLEWKTQGGAGVPVEKAAFPALPKGCKAEYPLQN
ncbi:hypothetical protein [Streptomyces sp. H34-S4]|uniref:hypothetical protein n=1 Tax=Streptomyces sp. H34-S4 TaxID=2996463 RepID=UPI00226EDDD9|nr:hypothetical protein [Streptomyces sp. H34-S4]MCY0935148.1 hypothetical protein [Streptomyces sp. H34-S4]